MERTAILKRLYKETFGLKPAGMSDQVMIDTLCGRGRLPSNWDHPVIDAALVEYNERFLERTGATKMGRFQRDPLNKVLAVASKAPAPVLVDMKQPVLPKMPVESDS